MATEPVANVNFTSTAGEPNGQNLSHLSEEDMHILNKAGGLYRLTAIYTVMYQFHQQRGPRA
jgi:hypothetical protein